MESSPPVTPPGPPTWWSGSRGGSPSRSRSSPGITPTRFAEQMASRAIRGSSRAPRAPEDQAPVEARRDARVVDRGDVPLHHVEVAGVAWVDDPQVGTRAIDADVLHAGGGGFAAEST